MQHLKKQSRLPEMLSELRIKVRGKAKVTDFQEWWLLAV